MFVISEMNGVDIEKEFGKEYVNKIRTNNYYKDFREKAIISKEYD